ncbi:MAG: NAD kinase [Bacteroidales bacterium]|nr:NAD kinase [Bacteroidales bacterium]
MNLAVYGRNFPKKFNGAAIQFFELLKSKGINIYINDKFQSFVQKNTLYNVPAKATYSTQLPEDIDFDILISIGGDGTFLEAVTYVYARNIPVLGINTGRLGFLATVNHEQLINAVNQIVEKKYSISKRWLLGIETEKGILEPYNFALNEFTLQKLNTLSMIKIKVFCNDEYVNTYWADGIIIATPTGSTAYSLSCNGPILTPDSDSFVITPIATHNMSVRPLVIPASSTIKLQAEGQVMNILASLDYRSQEIKSNNVVFIKKSNFYINIVNLSDNYYFSTLREKLMWGADLRN